MRRAIGRARPGGHPIPTAVRAPLESAFGADFRAVRVHRDARADDLNHALGATAFTGRDIFFRRGTFAPSSQTGGTLLAHELAHVVQQAAGSAAPAGAPVQCNRPEHFAGVQAGIQAGVEAEAEVEAFEQWVEQRAKLATVPEVDEESS